MPVRSKWQSLPTEQINPSTLAIDKLSPSDIVDRMLNEDRPKQRCPESLAITNCWRKSVAVVKA